MAKIDTLLDKLCTKPTPADFRFSDLRKIMTYFGYLESNKGATSGHFQKVVEMYSDCDDDTLLIKRCSCCTNRIPEMKWQKRPLTRW